MCVRLSLHPIGRRESWFKASSAPLFTIGGIADHGVRSSLLLLLFAREREALSFLRQSPLVQARPPRGVSQGATSATGRRQARRRSPCNITNDEGAMMLKEMVDEGADENWVLWCFVGDCDFNSDQPLPEGRGIVECYMGHAVGAVAPSS
ncbi:hypothetical protein LR48_Vigan03g282500 [Vigna angularis]|uniref:Uncharacterized protein n=1 Tax=Phaseolus angularis TaxID=3914 RepID=A0A0L9U9N7_PHAAN|nr:hypothetical protein LR48_Vigan03g282500 [Vigna angularis]